MSIVAMMIGPMNYLYRLEKILTTKAKAIMKLKKKEKQRNEMFIKDDRQFKH